MAGRECETALHALLAALAQQAYCFITPTPETHRRVLARREQAQARDLRDVFGWSLPFGRDLLDADLLEALMRGGLVVRLAGDLLRSKIRVASLGEHRFVHSAFPTAEKDAVFFGPDSYRFAALIESELRLAPDRRIETVIDIGTGSGVGAVVVGKLCADARLIGTDVNPLALRFAAVNAQAAGLHLQCCFSDTLAPIDGPIDLALANPPYMIDSDARDYRDGGGALGIEVAVEMAREALARLSPDGMLILYTGTPIVGGRDPLRAELAPIAEAVDCRLTYRELDPDVFGEELAKEAYRDAERIAVVAAVFDRRT